MLFRSNGHLEVVQWLREQGVSIHQKANNDWTLLHPAALNGHLEVVQWLREQGVSIHEKDNNGHTPLYLASWNGHLEVVQWLKDQGASIHQKDNNSEATGKKRLAGREFIELAAQELAQKTAQSQRENQKKPSRIRRLFSKGNSN